ncbi:hypothetical protein [Streptomyces sp. ALB3]|uniref:hypothetical protein n=1 Tax=Streptomyces sp. ALB3 TaxID=3374278 RepID=UPI00379D13CA
MDIHHLNCGCVLTIEATYDGPKPAAAVNHCLLMETDTAGLVLVETGLGLGDVRDPRGTLGADRVAMAQPTLDEEETTVRQVARLGHKPSDVVWHMAAVRTTTARRACTRCSSRCAPSVPAHRTRRATGGGLLHHTPP